SRLCYAACALPVGLCLREHCRRWRPLSQRRQPRVMLLFCRSQSTCLERGDSCPQFRVSLRGRSQLSDSQERILGCEVSTFLTPVLARVGIERGGGNTRKAVRYSSIQSWMIVHM